MMRDVTFDRLDDLVGTDLGYSDWIVIDQARIDAFAEATDDHQWIHVDEEAAAASSLGTTIAHGYLTVSLLPALVRQLWQPTGLRMSINYGLDRCRFPAPVPSGSPVRARATVERVELKPDGSKQVVLEATVEREGGAKPVCVATTVSRYFPNEDATPKETTA